MIASAIKMNARQFLNLGEDPVGTRLELIDGEMVASPSPAPRHSYTENILAHLLTGHILEKDLGQLFRDVDTIFGEHDVRRPDLLFFATNRLHLIGETAMEGMPDLAIEIISPSSTSMDHVKKFELYQKSGVKHYWLVDPAERTLEGYKLKSGRYVSTGKGKKDETVQLPPFDALRIPLKKLWRR